MIALLQRVSHGSVFVDGVAVGQIGHGIVLFLGIEKGDSTEQAEKLAERIVNYRLFADDDGKMNACLQDTLGGLLIVPQFTLAADTSQGRRPGFEPAAVPADAEPLFEKFVEAAYALHGQVAVGTFGADMQVNLTNDGPVTFILNG
ncbi:MAG: D-tyrosyl-tRNA(Tyr) deacylase [Gammaproteobacteria bacterium]|nr:MAG: D-tyrosyl-tRNA(Tyr) deacylase [Gammaproteobacteria bacterium]RLA11189.1 MAG: D-tyrosyl-tRNA(Tyr) deacylase [Gammaproteobacteria bacterium]